jgi:branched-chain amino acid transport system permease protein
MDGIFLQQLVNGLTLGSVYGLIAIGYTMVYGIIGISTSPTARFI